MTTKINTQDITDAAVTNAKVASGLDAAKITTGRLPSAQAPLLDECGFATIVKAAHFDVLFLQDQDDPELQFPVVAGHVYGVELKLYVGGDNASADCRAKLAVSSGTMTGWGTVHGVSGTPALMNGLVTAAAATATGTFVMNASGTLDQPCSNILNFSFKASANGTCTLQFGNSVLTSGATSRLMKGSYLKYKDIT